LHTVIFGEKCFSLVLCLVFQKYNVSYLGKKLFL
jgi:hypothetical protein